MSRKGWLLFVSMCVLWGIPYLFIRIAVRELPAPALVFLRTAPAALLLLPFALRAGQLRRMLHSWTWILLYTALEICIPWLLLAHAEVRISSSLAGLIIATVPLIGAIVYRVSGVEDHFGARRLTGLFIGFAGVIALVGLDLTRSDALGMAETIVTATCYALAPLVIARHLQELPAIGVITVSVVVTAVLYAPAGILTMPASLSAETIGSVVVLAIVCNALAFVVFFALIREVGPPRAMVFAYVNPLVAVLLGVVLLDEPFTMGIAVGMPLILVGSVFATSRARPGRDTRGAGVAAQPADDLASGPPGS